MKKMKKYLFVFVMALVSVTMINAQEDLTPSEGDFSIEVGFTPFNDNNAIISLPDGSIKGIYYVSDKVAIRLGLGFSTTSSNYNDHEEDWFKTNASQSQFSIAPGISYSFIGTERFAPYIGAELLFATSGNESQSDYKGGNQYIEKNHGAFNAYGVGLFTGFNYYFAKKLYVGVEAGIG
jgi:hypothetical protein